MATYKEVPSLSIHADQGVTALCFDPKADTLWTGLSNGCIVARHNAAQPFRGVTFPVSGKYNVTKISAGDSYVRALGLRSDGMGSWSKGGVNKWFYPYASSDPANAATLTTFSSESNSLQHLALASTASELIFIDSNTGRHIRRTTAPSVLTHLQFSHSHSALISGSFDGFVRAHDPRTGARDERSVTAPVRPHRGSIRSLQCSVNFIYTIGFGLGQSDRRALADKFVKVYDLRMMSMTPQVAVGLDFFPAFLHAIPRKSNSICVASSQGLVNIVDTSYSAGSRNEFCHLTASSDFSCSAISPTGGYIAFGDMAGNIRMLSAAAEATDATPPFHGLNKGDEPELPDTPDALPEIEWTDSTPLNVIGLPYYTAPLLSSYTPELGPHKGKVYFPPPQKIPQQVLENLKYSGNIGYATLPKELRGSRNMWALGKGARGGRGGGKFRSQQARDEESLSSNFDNFNDPVPKMYRKVEIEYSKFGVEDFDFASFNNTPYSGLETHILNSYTNSVVQVIHHMQPLSRFAKSHIALDCPREHCLLCEIGFVVRMLEDSEGRNCQASNFCRTVGVLAQAANAIELVDYGRMSNDPDYAVVIPRFHRFLVDNLVAAGNMSPNNPSIRPNLAAGNVASPVTQLLGVGAKNAVKCMACKAERKKENMTHVVDLIYPGRTTRTERSFATVLKASLLRHQTYKATCQECKQYATFLSSRSISMTDLPPILALNTCCHNEDIMRTWWMDSGKHRFLSRAEVEISGLEDGGDDGEVVVYEIRAIVAEIKGKNKSSHLVAVIKVGDAETKSAFLSPWFVFNDFVVTNVSEEEALSFPGTWKVPAIVYLQRAGIEDILDFSALPDQLDPAILCKDASISQNRDINLIKHELLGFDELPTRGTLVAIDAEFVSMQQEETEYKSDGTKKVLRPARSGLARVSVLRGSGDKKGVPFIDDHIHTSETIVDYLTEFSGIKFGDLDPRISPYTLTPLKIVYKKLRTLVDAGCIFIGHGLSKDFRIINIYVPPGQVLDTVDIYFLGSRQRRLSLKFLAWCILEERIQGDMHDSIEDAKTALLLYHASEKFKSEKIWRQKLDEVYKTGQTLKWKPPPSLEDTQHATTTNAEIRAQQGFSSTPVQRFNARTGGNSTYPSSLSSSPVPIRFSTPPYQYSGSDVGSPGRPS